METLKIEKTTPYGVQLKDGSYKNTTEPVRNYLRNQCPCEVEVTEQEGNKISKVKVLSTNDFKQAQEFKPQSIRQDFIDEASRKKTASVMISYAKDLAVAGLINVDEIAKQAKGFMNLQEELVSGNIPADNSAGHIKIEDMEVTYL